MSQDNSVSASALLPVSFQDTTLFLIEHQGEPFTPMRPIIEGMGLDWSSQRAKLKSNDARWGVVEIATPSNGGPQRSLCMPVRKLPAFFATIHPNKVRPELRERIVRYQAECDDVLWQHWTAQRPAIQSSPEIDVDRFMDALLRTGRWLAHIDRFGNIVFSPVDPNALVLPAEDWPKVIRTPDFPRHLLPAVLAAVSARLGGSQS